MHHRTKNEPDGSVTTWESPDGVSWHMTGQTYPERKLPEPVVTAAVALVEVEAEIIENYMPAHPTQFTKPRVVIRSGEWFLRYSKGPQTGTFWDVYGDDFQSLELAESELAKAPPVRQGKPYLTFKFPLPEAVPA